MPRPSLDEIFGSEPQGRPTLDQIFSQPPGAYQQRDYAPIPQPEPDNTEKSFGDIVSDVGSALMQPASLALDAISYLDKPRGAVAGAVKAYQENRPLWEGAQQGWKENTSWKETFDPVWVKENPNLSAVAGLATDIIADPLWVATPAKLAKTAMAGSKAIGLTDNVINPIAKTVRESELGSKLIAGTEDALGVNRLANTGVLDEYNHVMATDDVLRQDFTDPFKGLKKEFGEESANKATNVIEALPREAPTGNAAFDVVKATEDGSIYKAIKDGQITREEAFNKLRDSGNEIPDQLLQTHQRQAKAAGESIPDYIHRDDVLNAIENPAERKAIQAITDKVIEQNKKFSDEIYNIGRINDAEYVEFMGGSHLRRSYEKFETADDFLKSVKKNGTPEEWQRAYADYQKNKASHGVTAAHKIDQRDFMKRQTLSDETMKKMGLVTDAEYRVTDTFNRASKTLNEEKFLAKVNGLFGKTEQEAAALSRNLPKSREYIPIPDSKSYGALAGKWVPRDVANQVMNTLGTKPDNISKGWQKLVSWWKVSKLAAPAPIMRNLYSGLPMANVFGKVPTHALPREMAHVLQSFKNGGKNNAFIREFRSSGAMEGEWVGNELKNILGGKNKGVKRVAELGMEAFGTPDKYWRAVVYSYHRRQGKSIAEAGKIARKALLDYSNSPDWINWLSKTGVMPFAKFPFHAGKATAKALWENPAQVTKFTKAQNQTNNEDRQKILPDYLKAKTMLPIGDSTRIVNGKPQKIQQNIDLSYILPFASDFSFGNPVMDAVMLARTGKNGIGQQVIKPGMTGNEKMGAWGTYLANAVAPAAVSPYNIEKLYNAYQGNVDSKGRQYDMQSALLQTLGGVKNVPINTEELFKQGMAKNNMQQREIKSIMSTISKDQSLSKQQKIEMYQDHVNQLKQLSKQAKDMQQAYKREKKREAD